MWSVDTHVKTYPALFYGTTGMWRTTFGCQKWAPGPVLVAKFGLVRTTVGKGGPFLKTISGEGGHFWQLKLVWGTTFGPHQFLRDRPMYVGTQMDK